jgi:hypothetical protein
MEPGAISWMLGDLLLDLKLDISLSTHLIKHMVDHSRLHSLGLHLKLLRVRVTDKVRATHLRGSQSLEGVDRMFRTHILSKRVQVLNDP